jgi:probable HAF family extracellular repeat protein
MLRFKVTVFTTIVLFVLSGAVSTAFAAASLTPLGYLPGGAYSEADGVSADGSVVVGRSSDQAFRWTSNGGMVGLGDLPGGSFDGGAIGVSADGSVVVGRSSSNSFTEAFRWTSGGGMVGLGILPGWAGSLASCVSADGSVVVGYSSDSVLYSGGQAFRWTSGGGMVGLGFLPGASYSAANDVSADGKVVVGASGSASGAHAFRWTSGGGMVSLGDLPGGAFSPDARGVSADGSVIVGLTTDSFSSPGAFYWTADGGMRELWDVLLSHGVDPAADGWTELSGAYGISANGTTIVGSGMRNGNTEAFVAVVPEPAGLTLLVASAALAVCRRRATNLRRATN